MTKDREFDEDGFPILRFTPEEMAATRARMAEVVDCRALAETLLADRPTPSRDRLLELADAWGIDGTKTLTEIDGEDLGDANDVADEPEVHALRYVPVGRWLPGDIGLMLNYGHGVTIAAALAERLLRDDPLVEAQHYPGDLLQSFARMAEETRQMDALGDLIAAAKRQTWDLFETACNAAHLDDHARRESRNRLECGERSPPGQNPFLEVEGLLDIIAGVSDLVCPPTLLWLAQAKQLFAHYRPRKSIELVPLPDLDNADYRRTIADPETFKFRRDTRFAILHETSGGIRLRIFAESAVDHRHGIAFGTVEAAKAKALRDYGIAEEDWREAD